jgi:hypothetical protein
VIPIQRIGRLVRSRWFVILLGFHMRYLGAPKYM